MKKLKTSAVFLLCLLLTLCACPRTAADFTYTPVPLEIPVNAVGSYTLYADAALHNEKGSATLTAPGTLAFEGLRAEEPGGSTYYLKLVDDSGEKVYRVSFYVTVNESDRLAVTVRVFARDSDLKTEIRNYELLLLKIDSEKENGVSAPLSGARFELYRDADVEDGKPKTTASGTAAPLAAELVTGADGTLKLGDLQAGTYWLRETKAPAGYHRLTAMLRLVVGADGVTIDGRPADALDDSGAVIGGEIPPTQRVYRVTIENPKGAVLPGTGGGGTGIYYVLGAAMLLLALALAMLKKTQRR